MYTLRCPIFFVLSHHDGVKSVRVLLCTRHGCRTAALIYKTNSKSIHWLVRAAVRSLLDLCNNLTLVQALLLSVGVIFLLLVATVTDSSSGRPQVASHFSFIQIVNSLENYIRSVISPSSPRPLLCLFFPHFFSFHHPEPNEPLS